MAFIALLQDLHSIRSEVNRLENIVVQLQKEYEDDES